MTRGELVELLTAIMKAEIGRALDGTPLPGPDTSDDWSAQNGSIDLTEAAEAQLTALDKAGLAVVPVEPNRAMAHAMAKAMSPGRRPTPERVSCRDKHRIRYRAAVNAGRIDKEPEDGAH